MAAPSIIHYRPTVWVCKIYLQIQLRVIDLDNVTIEILCMCESMGNSVKDFDLRENICDAALYVHIEN